MTEAKLTFEMQSVRFGGGCLGFELPNNLFIVVFGVYSAGSAT